MGNPELVVTGIGAIASVLGAAYSYWQAHNARISQRTAEEHATAAKASADAAFALLEQARERNRILQEQSDRAALNDIRECLVRHEAARNYLQRMSLASFVWHNDQRESARQSGIDPIAVTNMCTYLNDLLSDANLDGEVLQFIRGAENALRAVLDQPDYSSFDRLKRLLNEQQMQAANA